MIINLKPALPIKFTAIGDVIRWRAYTYDFNQYKWLICGGSTMDNNVRQSKKHTLVGTSSKNQQHMHHLH